MNINISLEEIRGQDVSVDPVGRCWHVTVVVVLWNLQTRCLRVSLKFSFFVWLVDWMHQELASPKACNSSNVTCKMEGSHPWRYLTQWQMIVPLKKSQCLRLFVVRPMRWIPLGPVVLSLDGSCTSLACFTGLGANCAFSLLTLSQWTNFFVSTLYSFSKWFIMILKLAHEVGEGMIS